MELVAQDADGLTGEEEPEVAQAQGSKEGRSGLGRGGRRRRVRCADGGGEVAHSSGDQDAAAVRILHVDDRSERAGADRLDGCARSGRSPMPGTKFSAASTKPIGMRRFTTWRPCSVTRMRSWRPRRPSAGPWARACASSNRSCARSTRRCARARLRSILPCDARPARIPLGAGQRLDDRRCLLRGQRAVGDEAQDGLELLRHRNRPPRAAAWPPRRRSRRARGPEGRRAGRRRRSTAVAAELAGLARAGGGGGVAPVRRGASNLDVAGHRAEQEVRARRCR